MSRENLLANLFAFVMTALLLYTICVATNCADATDIHQPWFTEPAFLYSLDDEGTWHESTVTVKSIPGGTPIACFSMKGKRQVKCFYSVEGSSIPAVIDQLPQGQEAV